MNVKLSRSLFLVLCGLLCIVLVVPVQSATNLVENGDFSLGDAVVIDDWVQDSGQATLDTGEYRSHPQSLACSGSGDMSYSQCVDTSGLTSVDVGGWVLLATDDVGSIEVTLYSATGCHDDDLAAGGSELVLTDEDDIGIWAELRGTYPLPEGEDNTSVKVTLNAMNDADAGDARFDDIFVEESAATSVLVVNAAAGRAPTGLIAAAVLGGIGAVAALKRLNVLTLFQPPPRHNLESAPHRLLRHEDEIPPAAGAGDFPS